MELSEEDKSRGRFHLGYASPTGIYEQDVRQIEQSFTDIRDLHTYQRILDQLDRCDRAFDQTDITKEPGVRKTLYAGDLNRARVDFELATAMRQWQEYYLTECDMLATILHVPNYRRPHIAAARRERYGSVYVQPIPGPADTATISVLDSLDLISGGTGF